MYRRREVRVKHFVSKNRWNTRQKRRQRKRAMVKKKNGIKEGKSEK